MIREDKRIDLYERVWKYQLSLEKPLTNYEIAKEIGISPGTFGNFMDGKKVDNTTLIRIEKFLLRHEGFDGQELRRTGPAREGRGSRPSKKRDS